MPNTIDTLAVEVELKTKGFDTGIKQIEDALKRISDLAANVSQKINGAFNFTTNTSQFKDISKSITDSFKDIKGVELFSDDSFDSSKIKKELEDVKDSVGGIGDESVKSINELVDSISNISNEKVDIQFNKDPFDGAFDSAQKYYDKLQELENISDEVRRIFDAFNTTYKIDLNFKSVKDLDYLIKQTKQELDIVSPLKFEGVDEQVAELKQKLQSLQKIKDFRIQLKLKDSTDLLNEVARMAKEAEEVFNEKFGSAWDNAKLQTNIQNSLKFDFPTNTIESQINGIVGKIRSVNASINENSGDKLFTDMQMDNLKQYKEELYKIINALASVNDMSTSDVLQKIKIQFPDLYSSMNNSLNTQSNNQQSTGIGKTLGTIAKATLGIRSIYMLVRKIVSQNQKLVNSISSLISTVANVLKPILDVVAYIIQFIAEYMGQLFQVETSTNEEVKNLAGFDELEILDEDSNAEYEAMKEKVQEKESTFVEIAATIPDADAQQLQDFANGWKLIFEEIGKLFKNIGDWFDNTVVPWIQDIPNKLNVAFTWVGDIWTDFKGGFNWAITGIKEDWNNLVASISNAWNNTWTGVSNFFSNIWTNLKSGVIAVINSISDSIETAVNNTINAINNSGVMKVIDKLTGWSIGTVDIPTIEVPTVNANIGNSNIGATVNTNNSEMVSAYAQIGQQIVTAINNKDTSVTIDDTTIAKSASRGSRTYYNRTGKTIALTV